MPTIDRPGRNALALAGRAEECDVLDELLADMRVGKSRSLVIRGDAGIGKTALVNYATDAAVGFEIARAVGIESEMQLPFAGLHQVCRRMFERIDRLPAPQADALRIAFGMRSGDSADRFLVGLAVLSLLSDTAEAQPLLCVVDDAQWLDKATVQILAFVARRLDNESVGLLFAARTQGGDVDWEGLPALVLEGIADRDARVLLESVFPGGLDARVRDRIVAEARGNPLALLQLPRSIETGEIAGGFSMSTSSPLAGRIEQSFLRRYESLGQPTRQLLLAAAAEPLGDASLLSRAALNLGLSADDAPESEAEELVQFSKSRVIFHHPLVRSAIYGAAPNAERRRVHRALADATDAATDPDRRAWHRAQATSGPDEQVAEELERSAGRALDRGDVAAAAAFLERAVALTPDAAVRSARALAAASLKHEAGATDTALELLAVAEAGEPDALREAQVARLRGQIAYALRHGRDAPALLLDAAKRFEPLDVALARETYLEAFAAAMSAGRLSDGVGVSEVGMAARSAPAAPLPPRAIDLLLDGLVVHVTQGYAAGVAPLRRALQAFNLADDTDRDDMRWLWMAYRVAFELWDDDISEITTRQLRLARDAGALGLLPMALLFQASVDLNAGNFPAASALIDESAAITEAIGAAPLRHTALVLASWRGDDTGALSLIEESAHDAATRGEGRAIALGDSLAAVLHNSHRHYDAAFAAAQRACEGDDFGQGAWALIELVESAVRTDRRDVAELALQRLAERTQASGTELALGLEARTRALLRDGPVADVLYREAIERLARTKFIVQLARAHLHYGEWLRRASQRAAAREHLRNAHAMFEDMGAAAFAARAAGELRATGEKPRARTVETRVSLTGQEEQIARLANEGRSNPEIATQLFISPRTVEYHLHKVFTKLDITSRNQLGQVLSAP